MNEGHAAITFGDLSDPNSRVSKSIKNTDNRRLRADLKLKQRVTYSGF
jgi:Fe-S-cluster-containing dehydrogenase component